MRHANQGLELWYGTPDAPAPAGTTEGRDQIQIVLGVQPATSASVRYRVNGGSPLVEPAIRITTDYARNVQYFRAALRALRPGDFVEYIPIATCAGRRVPDPLTATTFPCSFTVAPLASSPAPVRSPSTPGPARRDAIQLDFLASAQLRLTRPPAMIGPTPAGYVVNLPPAEGTLSGPAFRATLKTLGEHEMLVRADGIGLLDVAATIETADDALISVRYAALVELGKDGAELVKNGQWPSIAPVRSAPRLLTGDRRYEWLNRLQCVELGTIWPTELIYTYDLYSIK